MNLNLLAKTVSIHYGLVLIFTFILVRFHFFLREGLYAILILSLLAGVSVYNGQKSGEEAPVQGFFLGVCSFGLLLISLLPFVDMDWALNGILFLLWVFVSTVMSTFGSTIASMMTKASTRRALFKQRQKT